jgi:hypothetical protein
MKKRLSEKKDLRIKSGFVIRYFGIPSKLHRIYHFTDILAIHGRNLDRGSVLIVFTVSLSFYK